MPQPDPDLARIVADAPADVLALFPSRDLLAAAMEQALARGPEAAREIERSARDRASLFRHRAEFRERFGLMTEAEACAFLQCGRDAIRGYRRDPLHPLPVLAVGEETAQGRRYLYPVDGLFAWLVRLREREFRPRPRKPVRMRRPPRRDSRST
jgi:hypothetical protein